MSCSQSDFICIPRDALSSKCPFKGFSIIQILLSIFVITVIISVVADYVNESSKKCPFTCPLKSSSGKCPVVCPIKDNDCFIKKTVLSEEEEHSELFDELKEIKKQISFLSEKISELSSTSEEEIEEA